MISFFVFIAVLSVLIVVHEFGHFIMAKLNGVQVEKFSIGFGPQLLKKKKGGTEYSLSAIPLGGYVKLAGDSLEEYAGSQSEYYTQPPGRRFRIIFCGPLLNYLLGFLCFWVLFFVGYPDFAPRVGALVDGFGAQAAGIEVGDRILSINGSQISSWEEIPRVVQDPRLPDEVPVSVERGNTVMDFRVKIKQDERDDFLGAKKKVGMLGVSPDMDDIMHLRYGFFESFARGAEQTLELTVFSYKGLWRMITGQLSVKESVTGPLGIFVITAEATNQGFIALLNLVAILNISLAIFNLLPLPILDGGHILFLGIEKLRGRPLSVKTERIITQIGLTFIITLAVLVTYNDILRLIKG